MDVRFERSWRAQTLTTFFSTPTSVCKTNFTMAKSTKKELRSTDTRHVTKTTTLPAGLKALLRRFKKQKFEYVQCGRIDSVADGIARVYGLDGVQAGELLEFVSKSGDIIRGMALNLEKEFVGAVLFGKDTDLKEGDFSRRTKSIISVPTGIFLRGRVVDPLGLPLDEKGALPATKQELIERKAPGIQLRARIDSPMATGIRAVDSLVPIGNGHIGRSVM